jgi:parallel beta-helix repeat protein
MKKILTCVFIIFLCSSLLAILNCGLVKAQPKTIVVPDDYATIQEAINNATEGDTVFVKSGVYHDLALVNKSLSLVGENRDTTIIDSIGIESRVYIEADYVTVTGFTIRNADSHGIRLGLIRFESDSIYQPVGCKIIGNNILNNFQGINVRGGTEHIISENNITGSTSHGIFMRSSKSIISKNNISNNFESGIIADSCSNLIIKGNIIKGNGFSETLGIGGLSLRWNGPFYIYGNNITDNRAGIQFGEGCNNSSVSKNNIVQNDIGVELLNFRVDNYSIGSGNMVYNNNIIDNSKQVLVNNEYFFKEIIEEPFRFINGTDLVSWDNGNKGNYWRNYDGKDNNADGIGETSYYINENNQDNKPIIRPIETPKFQSSIMSIDEATLAVNIEIIADYFIGARKIGEPVGEPYLYDSEVTGYLMWLASNGTIYQAEYPNGTILGEYLITHKLYWDSLEGSYIWNLNYRDSETYWVEATNGTILQHTNFIFEESSNESLDSDEPPFQWSPGSIIAITLAVMTIIGANLLFIRYLRKTTNNVRQGNTVLRASRP